MLEPWEKAMINFIVLATIFLTLYTSYLYVPEYLEYTVLIFADYFPILEQQLPTSFI